MRIFICLMTVFIISGCTALDIAIKTHTAVSQEGAEAADAFLEGNIRELCYWATIGALRRKYGDNPELFKAYNDFCNLSLKSELIIPRDLSKS